MSEAVTARHRGCTPPRLPILRAAQWSIHDGLFEVVPAPPGTASAPRKTGAPTAKR